MNDGLGVASAGIGAGGSSCSANSGQYRNDPRTLIRAGVNSACADWWPVRAGLHKFVARPMDLI